MIRTLWRIGDVPARRILARYLLVAVLSTLLLSGVLIALIPVVRALFSSDPAGVVGPLLLLAGLGAAAAVADWFATALGQRLGAAYVLRMHGLIADRAARLPLGWFEVERSGSISQMVMRGVTFAANAPEAMLRPMLHALGAPVLAGIAAGVLVHPLLGLVLLVSSALVGLVYRWAQGRAERLELELDRRSEEGAASVLEFARVQPAVRAAGPDSLAERSVRAALAAQRTATDATLVERGLGGWLYTAVCHAGMLLMLVVAVLLAGAGAIDGPGFAAMLALGILVDLLALQSLPFGQGVDMAQRTLAELDALLTAPLLPEPESDSEPAANEESASEPRAGASAAAASAAVEPVDSSIEFQDVHFGYDDGPAVLSGVSFRVEPGTMTAIVGPSGSGKTTLARLIARFYDVRAGRILIGGRDLRELGTRRVMAQISMVFQDVYLFEDSLRENIRLGRAGADDAAVEDAAARAGVAEIAERLPGGLDAGVGESGASLSGGERQRVSIARALLKEAPIVLLDEATAALDVESEALVQRGLADLAGGTTLVVIAHRMQTIRQAEQIVVLDGRGGVEAVGDHETLLGASGTYAGFWAAREQSSGWRIDAR